MSYISYKTTYKANITLDDTSLTIITDAFDAKKTLLAWIILILMKWTLSQIFNLFTFKISNLEGPY